MRALCGARFRSVAASVEGTQLARSGQPLNTISLLSNANLENGAMTTDRFEEFGWHDNAIHAFRISEGDDGCSGNLILDIDYILEWISPSAQDGNFSFVVSPADLVFLEVTDLVISTDYASSSVALQPMTIDEISREVVTYPNGYSEFAWKIELNWPETWESKTAKSQGPVWVGRRRSIRSELGQKWSLRKRQHQHITLRVTSLCTAFAAL